jgi:hypothetical protein
LNGSPSYLLTACPYHLSLASLTFFAMSTTSHLRITCPYYLYLTFLYFLTLRISSSHNISDKLSFISLITYPCHVKLASSPSLQCLPPQIFWCTTNDSYFV